MRIISIQKGWTIYIDCKYDFLHAVIQISKTRQCGQPNNNDVKLL